MGVRSRSKGLLAMLSEIETTLDSNKLERTSAAAFILLDFIVRRYGEPDEMITELVAMGHSPVLPK